MNFLNISKKLSYGFLFLLPFFFIPNSIVSPVMNQKALILVFIILAFASFAVAAFKNKENSINLKLSGKIILGFLLSVAISLFVSGYVFQGYWGYSMQSDSLFCFILFSSLFFLFSNIFDTKDRENAYKSFSIGAFTLALIYLFQIFLGSKLQLQTVLPANAESSIIFSSALIFSIYYIFKNFEFKKSKKVKLVIASFSSIVFVVALYLMGIKFGWILAAIGAFFIFWKGMQKREFDFNYPEPFISFLLVLFFLINFLLPLNDFPILKPFAYSEPVMTYGQSFDVIKKSFDSPQKLIFGSGPASFPYNYSLHKGEAFGASEEVPTHPNGGFFLILNDFGLLGSLLFLSLFIVFVWKAISYMMKEPEGDRDKDELLFISSVLIFFLAIFFYRFSFIITSLLFVFLGLYFSGERKILLEGAKNNVYKVFLGVFSLVLILNLYFFVQYQAEYNYQTFSMLSSKDSKYKEIFSEEQSLEKAIELLENSSKLFSNADYSVYLSKAYLSKAVYYYDIYSNAGDDTKGEDAKKTAFNYVSKAENYAKEATSLNARNFFVWENLGMVYEDIEKIDSSKAGEAIRAYEKAAALAPFNYEIYALHGRKLEKDGNKTEALKFYKKSLALNPDFIELETVINSLEKNN
jgi:uncharacterized protein YdcH (DUF465 family)